MSIENGISVIGNQGELSHRPESSGYHQTRHAMHNVGFRWLGVGEIIDEGLEIDEHWPVLSSTPHTSRRNNLERSTTITSQANVKGQRH